MVASPGAVRRASWRETPLAAVRYFIALALAIAATHLAYSGTVGLLIETLHGHRVLNLRKVANEGTRWEDLSSSFVRHVADDAIGRRAPLMLFLGSSVTWGYPWQEAVIYSRRVADQAPDWRVANLSIIGVGMRGLTDFATCALGPQHRAQLLVVEIPLVNSTASLTNDVKHPPRACARPGAGEGDYRRLVLERPWGIGWLAFFATEQRIRLQEVGLQPGPVPRGYFADRKTFAEMEPLFEQELRRFLGTVSAMGDRVVVFASPIHTPGIRSAGADQEAVEAQLAAVLRVCAQVPGVECLDPGAINRDRNLFLNLTHLNQRGHRAVAEWLLAHVGAAPLPVPGASR